VSTFLTWRVWLSQVVDPGHVLGLVAAVLLLAGGLTRLWRRRGDWAAFPESPLILAMGFAGMTLEIILLFVFQSASGALFWQMGILMGAFMGGLAVGSGTLNPAKPGRHSFALLAGAAVLLAALCAAIAAQLPRLLTVHSPLTVFSLLLAGTGLLVGAAFPLAANLRPQQAGAIYAGDLWGSALGAFTAGTFLAPLAGCVRTAAAAGGLVLISLLAAAVLRKRRS